MEGYFNKITKPFVSNKHLIESHIVRVSSINCKKYGTPQIYFHKTDDFVYSETTSGLFSAWAQLRFIKDSLEF